MRMYPLAHIEKHAKKRARGLKNDRSRATFICLRLAFVVTVRILRRGHCFALIYVDAVNHLAVAVNDVVLAGSGAGITAI